jgi:hypothetical protein
MIGLLAEMSAEKSTLDLTELNSCARDLAHIYIHKVSIDDGDVIDSTCSLSTCNTLYLFKEIMASKRIVLITGANTGLGYQMVRALCGSQQSYQILLGGRSPEKAQKATEDVLAEFPSTSSSVVPIQIDIEDDKSIETAFNEVDKTYGQLDALVNNAGKSI